MENLFCIHWVGTGSRVKIVKICLTIYAGGGGSKLDCDVSLMGKTLLIGFVLNLC